MSMPARSCYHRLALALSLALWCQAAPAERASAIDLGVRSPTPRSTERSSDAAPGSRSILRCFQAGRLIHESAGQAPLANDAAVHSFAAGDAPSSLVQVLDLHQAVCLWIGPVAPRP